MARHYPSLLIPALTVPAELWPPIRVSILGTPLAIDVANQAPCPYKIETKFEEPLRTLSKFTLKFTPEPSAPLTEMKVDFGVHNLYEIKDSEGNKFRSEHSKSKRSHAVRDRIGARQSGPYIAQRSATASRTDCSDSHLIDAGFRRYCHSEKPHAGY